MPQPISSSSNQNFTAYDPSEDMSRADGGTAGTGGASGAGYQGGSQGAGNVSASAPAPREQPSCMPEALKTASTCGAMLLLSRVPTPGALISGMGCAGNVMSLIQCAAGSKSKTEAP